MSVIIGFAGPVLEYWYLKDYWHPKMIIEPSWPFGGIECYLFAFAIGGIGGAIYEVLLRKRLVCPRDAKRRRDWALLAFPIILLAAMTILTDIYGLNSIYVSSLSFLVAFALMVKLRPDLFKKAVISGLFVAAIMFIFYLLYFGVFPWFLEAAFFEFPRRVLILGQIPLTELVWGMTWGMAAGPFYEFWRGCKLESAAQTR